jgi:transposase-like protein
MTTPSPRRAPPQFVWIRKPHCPNCDSVRLKIMHTSKNGDASITRYSKCQDCGRNVHVVVE